MTSANDRQVAGSHYQSAYQHWDFVADTGMPYLLGCATKYLTRWRKKNGVQDLEKAIHYIDKAIEVGVYMEATPAVLRLTEVFIKEAVDGEVEGTIIREIVRGYYLSATGRIKELITTA